MSEIRSIDDIREICNLDDQAFSQRLTALRDHGFFSRIRGRERLADGVALAFDKSPENREAVAEFVAFERKCCSSLNFEIREEPDALHLDIRGIDPSSTLFGANDEAAPATGFRWSRLLKSTAGGTVLSLTLCCVLPLGVVAIAGAAIAAPFAMLDNPYIIVANAAVIGAFLWRRDRKRVAATQPASNSEGCGC